MASVNRPRNCIAEVADDSTIVWIAFVTSAFVTSFSVARMCTRLAGAAGSGLVMMTKEMDDAEEDDDAEMKDY